MIGSGIMGERLAAGNAAVALIVNTLSTVCGLYVLIEVCGPIGGAHFNPAVSAVMAYKGILPRALLPAYVVAQFAGAVFGAWLAHAMFDVGILQLSTKVRSGYGQWFAEIVATAGLVLVILRAPAARVAAMVAAFIGSAYFFTASTSFANPAAAVGRMFTESFAGIAPSSVPGFIGAQLLGAAVAVAIGSAFTAPAGHSQQGQGQHREQGKTDRSTCAAPVRGSPSMKNENPASERPFLLG